MSSKGLSLIEVILYTALIGVLLPIITYFLFFILRIMNTSVIISSVNSQASETINFINQIIRNADKITFPLLGESSSSLSLIIFKTGNVTSSITINLDSGKIKLKEGENTNYLTNSGVAVSGLLFSNVSRGGTAGSIKIQFTIATSTYSKIFYGSASLREH